MTKNVAILLFNEVEVLDFAWPFEVFSVTQSLDGDSLFNVYTVAETTHPILARNNLSINPDYTLENHPSPDILIIPGGFGSRAALKQPNIIKWVQQSAQQTQLILSVCTGALILAKAGLVNYPTTESRASYPTDCETVDFLRPLLSCLTSGQ